MAPKSVVEIACEPLDAEIARLQAEIEGHERSKALIRQAHAATVANQPKVRKPRGPNKRRAGLPAVSNDSGE